MPLPKAPLQRGTILDKSAYGKKTADVTAPAARAQDVTPAAAAVTASAAAAGTRTVKAAAPAALPQTGDGFPIEALAAAFCASIIGFGTAWKRR